MIRHAAPDSPSLTHPVAPHALVIQHVAVEGPARIAARLQRHGIGCRIVRTWPGEPVPHTVAPACALVVMGGPMGVYDARDYPNLTDEMRLIERATRDGVPTLGVCLGSQLIAAAAGARVYPGPAKEIGYHPVTLSAAAATDPLFGTAPQTFTPLHWHGDVFELPQGATPLAASAMTTHQAFRLADSTWALLFHLEADVSEVAAMSHAFADELADAGVDADALNAATPRHVAAIAPIADRVFDQFTALALALARHRSPTPPG